jgi:GDP-L-fucose synthase
MKVLVTGGSGFVGKRLQKLKPEWIYLSSSDVNLLSYDDCLATFKKIKPDAVIHLAARVGGIKDNSEKPAEFFHQNITMNTNVVHACYNAGIKRLLASLSTCAFPNIVDHYPFHEENIFDGPPAETNRAYGFSKRALYVHILAYREQYGLDYSCFCPSNLYGPEDHFDPQKSHFIPATIKKLHDAEDNSTIEVWGTGKPLRQALFIDDLCNALPHLLEKHHSKLPIIVAPDFQHSVHEIVNLCKYTMGKNVTLEFNGNLDGQYRKDGSNARFKELCPEFKFTSLEDGLRKTYEWYCK